MSKVKETMESLDIKTLPLDGTVCIEASAGTGKTYTIGLIVLRLVMEQGLEAAKLAVVTFTEAAAGELAERIAEFLRIARDYAVDTIQNDEQRQQAKESKHSIIYDLVDAAIAKEGEKVIIRLNGALLNYDLAQIITIHGFCLRLLNDFAFETGSAYGVEFVKDQDALINEILADFWRREISGLSPEVFRLLGDVTPDTMREYYDSFLKHPHLEVKGPQLEKRVIEQYATSYALIHQQWIDSYDEINKMLTEEVSRFNQNSMKVSRIPTYMDDVDDVFTSGNINREVMEVFSARKLQECLRSGSIYSIPSIPYVEAIDGFLDTYETLPDKITAHFMRLGYAYLRKELVSRKKELRIRTFDNMISDLSQSLAGSNKTAAIDAIRQRFTAVLVDEFQDTDALQYSIFYTLFASYKSIFFAMIGDPKQAIYEFRGG
ncbi:MAG: UvrD-helicase domain-containing protein, partial [Bacteroidota bacterium]